MCRAVKEDIGRKKNRDSHRKGEGRTDDTFSDGTYDRAVPIGAARYFLEVEI